MGNHCGDRIREARRAAGLTQSRVAQHFGVDKSTVYRWERGALVPSLERLSELAELFGTSRAHLAFGDEATPTV